MRLTFAAAVITVSLTAAAEAAPARSSGDELFCDFASDLLEHLFRLRANGYSQGAAAKSAGGFIGQWFDTEAMSDQKFVAQVGHASTRLVQYTYSQPRHIIEHDASLSDLSLQIYEECMRDGF